MAHLLFFSFFIVYIVRALVEYEEARPRMKELLDTKLGMVLMFLLFFNMTYMKIKLKLHTKKTVMFSLMRYKKNFFPF